MKITKKELQRLVENERNAVLNEQTGVLVATGLSVLGSMLITSGGRKTLAKIIMVVPNLIDALCESVFPETDTSGELLSNLKTKLCKVVSYGAVGMLAVPCKIVGELLLMLDDDSAKVVANEINKSAAPATPEVVPEVVPESEPEVVPFDLPDVPTADTLDIPYTPEAELDLMEGNIIRSRIRQMIIQELRQNK